MDAAFELLKDGHGLLREMTGVRVWSVDDGALVLGEDATHFVFCHQGALTVRQHGQWPHVLTAGMYGSVPGKCEVRPVGQDLTKAMVISALGWLGMEAEEVIRLVNRAGMPTQVRKVAPAFNKAWVPGKG